MVVVGAPAGCGKTTAVDEWVRSLPDIAIWARATAPHTGSAWQALLGGLSRTGIFVSDAEGRCGLNRLATLARRIIRLPRPVTVVLDGFEINEQAAGAQILSLLRLADGRLRVVLTARGNPIVRCGRSGPAARLDLSQQDLAFTDHEAEDLFGALGVDVDRERIHRVNRILRGWP